MEIVDFLANGLKRKAPVIVTNALTWILIFGISTLLLSGIVPPIHAFVFSLCNISLLALAYFISIYISSQLLEKKKYRQGILYFIVLLIAVTYSRFLFNDFYLSRFVQLSISISHNWKYVFPFFSTLIVMILGLFYGLLINRSRNEKKYQLIIDQQREDQLQFLKAQMSPHFLFNSLNNIYALTIGKATQASEMILLLSDVLRYAVYESRQSKVSLQNEVSQIKKLIRLYELKSEGALPIKLEVSILSHTTSIEPMILIPLVENCFKHSNLETCKDAYITIRLTETQNSITFQTINTKDKTEKSKDEASGIGLKNIKQRLDMQYPQHHLLKVEESAELFSLLLKIEHTHG